ncbi:MAG: flavin reductase family protein [Halobacteriales archaeon]
MDVSDDSDMVRLQPDQPFQESAYTVSPLVIVGTRSPEGEDDLAPKHMAFPVGWDDYYGFVCTPEHQTYANAVDTGVFTVSYPKPDGLLDATMAAGPRTESGDKPTLGYVDRVEASEVDAPVVADAYAVLECELERAVDGFGRASFVVGEAKAKYVDRDALRHDDSDADRLLGKAPLLAYLYPDRVTAVDESIEFPFPGGFER